MDRKTWAMLGGFAALLVGSIVLLVFGISGHSEPGFAHAERGWSSVPLSVSCRGYAPEDQGECASARSVVNGLNTRLGFSMLRWAPDDSAADIRITINAPVEVGDPGPCGTPGECFELKGSDAMYSECDVRTMAVSGAGDLQQLVIQHGIGHCLGLAHDANAGPLTLHSIMQPVQHPTPDGEIPRWIDDWDRDLLRERYLKP